MWWELFSEGKIIPTVSKSTVTHHQIRELAAIGKSLLNLAGFYTRYSKIDGAWEFLKFELQAKAWYNMKT